MSPGKQMLENSSPGGAWESGVTVGGPLCFPFSSHGHEKESLIGPEHTFLFIDLFLLIEALNLFPFASGLSVQLKLSLRKKNKTKTNSRVVPLTEEGCVSES